METGTLRAFLRVLYTVNNNPQYILAKSSSQVPAIVCSETTTQSATSEPAYARVPLKACLAAVCDSSPELLQDPARDFSLYVLDPLEAQPLPTSLAHAPHNTHSPRGVAVALGLMSWALESSDSMNVMVTGTITPNAPPVLEVVFALRETKRMPKPALHSYPSLGPISALGTSQPLNSFHPPQAAGMTWLSTSHLRRDLQEQRTLTRSADFPELYIGPPRRAPGRPEGSTSSKSKVKSQASTTLPGAGSLKTVETQSKSKQEVRRSKTKPQRPRAPPTYSPFTCGPLTRHPATGGPEAGATGIPAFDQQSHPISQNPPQSHAQKFPRTQPYSHPTHNLLLGLLSAIPSTLSGNTPANTAPEQQAALLSALQGLLATNPHLLQLAATNTSPSTSNGEQTAESKPMRGGNNKDDEHDDADSDIVILDSSTIDTTAFRKSSNRQHASSDHGTSPAVANQEFPTPSNQGTESSPLPASTPPDGQDGTPASSHTSALTVTPEVETPTSKHISSGRAERGNVTPSNALDMPATPTPSRTRKRKFGEYIEGQAHSSTPMSPPSPSPSVTRTSSSRRGLTARQGVQSSPTGGTQFVSSPSVRLPSMLGSMRSMATSASRLQAKFLGSSAQGHLASSTTNKNGNQSSTLASCPSKSKADHTVIADAPSNNISDTTTLKRRRTLGLNEFMAEQEARKNARVRKRPSSGRKSEVEVSANTSQAVSPRSAKLGSTWRLTQTSPPRPLFRSDSGTSSLPASTCPSSLASQAAVHNPPMTTSACEAPHSSISTAAAQTTNALKNFVLPTWARTSTAMLPRLSEEALARQRAEQEAKKAQVSLRRREAARAKRKRLRGTDHPSKESSDEDEEAVTNDPKPRIPHPSSSVARSAPLLPLPLPSLPVFASDAVEPIPSSPPPSHRQLAPPVVPSTPPRKPASPGSVPYRTPNKPGSCSLFTPSGQGPGSLFTPSTPSLTPSLTRVTFTPRSPTVLHRSGAKNSPRKSIPQTLWTPKRNTANHQTPRSSRNGRNPPFASPKSVIRTPQTQTGMGTRAFLLPPPSPCNLQTPYPQSQVLSKVPGSPTPLFPNNSAITGEESPSDKQNVEWNKGSKEEDILGCELDEALMREDIPIPPALRSPTCPDDQETSELRDITSNGDAPQAEEEFASSPLPPSSPLPASPFSSPAKHNDSSFDTPTINNLVIPDSDILPHSASDSDRPQAAPDPTWLSDDACTASWFTDSEVSAWFTETDTWLTDTEGGPLLADSDGAWLSDSDAVFGDMSSLPPSSASNWLSDDADVDTDCEVGTMEGRDGGFDTAAFERAFAALVEREGRSVVDKEEGDGDSGATHGTKVAEPEFWESMLRRSALDDRGMATEDMGDSANEDKVAQDIQKLLDGLGGT